MENGTDKQPRVSVVMCTYNGSRFLREQMNSILAQDYPLHEIIVQDDRSTDDTWDILEAYQREHPGLFKLYRNDQNLGFNRNFHTAMLRATGDFIAISDQDDIWLPQKIRRQVETIGESDLCFTDMYVFWDNTPAEHTETDYVTHFLFMLLWGGGAGHTMLARTDFVRSITEWEQCIYYDWWMALHAQMGRGVVKVAEPLNYHRHHRGSVTTRYYEKGKWSPVAKPTWQPYVKGYFFLRHWQKKASFRNFYSYFTREIDAERFPEESKLVKLLLSRNPVSTLRLCMFCRRHYKEIYHSHPHGLLGKIHGFFAPLIMAYVSDTFSHGNW